MPIKKTDISRTEGLIYPPNRSGGPAEDRPIGAMQTPLALEVQHPATYRNLGSRPIITRGRPCGYVGDALPTLFFGHCKSVFGN